MNKKGMSFISLTIILTALVVGYLVSSQANFNVENFKGNLTWENVNISTPDQAELGNAISYYINGLGSALLEVLKWVTQYSAENPTVPYKLLIYGLLISILMPIIWYVMLMLVSIFLIIKEWRANKKEKKYLQKEVK